MAQLFFQPFDQANPAEREARELVERLGPKLRYARRSLDRGHGEAGARLWREALAEVHDATVRSALLRITGNLDLLTDA